MNDPWGRKTADVSGAADGWVRVELHEDGRIRDVILDPQAMSMPVSQLSAALVQAIREAQESVRARAADMTREYGGLPSRERLQAAADDATAVAERRFAEISTVLYDLDRRAEREW